MEQTTNKININAEGELLRLGSDIIELEDRTSSRFETDDFDAFKKFIKRKNTEKEASLYCWEDGISLWPDEQNFYSTALASCDFSQDPRLTLVRQIANGSRFDLDETETLLKKLKPYFDANGKDLLDHVLNFNLSKITNIQKHKDNAGNFNYQVSVEKGKSDFEPPETVRFIVPAISGFDDRISITLDVSFSYTQVGEAFRAGFLFENFEIDDQVQKFKKETIVNALEGSEFPFYWGSNNLSKNTNESLLKTNELVITKDRG